MKAKSRLNSSGDADRVQTILPALLKNRASVVFKAGGQSMRPFINPDESVRVTPFEPGHLRPGAILLYRAHGRLILHRLIGRETASERLIFTGDAALRGTETIDKNQVVGTARAVFRNGRSFPLHGAFSRYIGLLFYHLRPVRRLLFGHIHDAAPID